MFLIGPPPSDSNPAYLLYTLYPPWTSLFGVLLYLPFGLSCLLFLLLIKSFFVSHHSIEPVLLFYHHVTLDQRGPEVAADQAVPQHPSPQVLVTSRLSQVWELTKGCTRHEINILYKCTHAGHTVTLSTRSCGRKIWSLHEHTLTHAKFFRSKKFLSCGVCSLSCPEEIALTRPQLG